MVMSSHTKFSTRQDYETGTWKTEIHMMKCHREKCSKAAIPTKKDRFYNDPLEEDTVITGRQF